MTLRLALTAIIAMAAAPMAVADEVRVMISAGYFSVYADAGPKFEQATGHKLITVRGPSMGDSPEAIPTRLARNEPADVVIMDGHGAEALAKKGLVKADTQVELARSQVGMVVKEGALKPDISTMEALKKTLLDAKSIAYSDSGSGTYLSTTLFQKMGIADQVLPRSRKVRGPPSGEPVAAVIARGEAEIGFQQVSELIHTQGVTVVGPLPPEAQPGFTFAGAVTASSTHPEAAKALLAWLRRPEVVAVIEKNGLGAPSK